MRRPSASARTLSTFASLRVPAFRLFVTSQVVGYTGTWVLRVAQDWLVLSLTGSVAAVGITSGLQSVPIVVLGPVGGLLADRYPKRLVLFAAQAVAATIAAVLAFLAFAGLVQVWHVYLAAVGIGAAFSLEAPARHSFINELVGPALVRNAVSINASTIQFGALLGPAISGALLNALGFGWAFALNACSYIPALIALARLRRVQPPASAASRANGPRLRDGVRYVLGRRDILCTSVLVFVFGMFTINLTTTLAAFTKTIFHSGAGGYGLLNSTLAVGSLAGALISARLARTRMRTLLGAACGLATVYTLASLAPNRIVYCVALVALGVHLMLFYTSANAGIQLAAEDAIRGRVMGIYAVVYFGGGALGGPLVGSLDTRLGPRSGMFISGLVPALATVVVGLVLSRAARVATVQRAAELEANAA